MRAKLLQLYLTLCDPMDYSLPGSSVHGILQAKILSVLPFPFPGDLPNPGIKLRCPALQVEFLASKPPENPFCLKALITQRNIITENIQRQKNLKEAASKF